MKKPTIDALTICTVTAKDQGCAHPKATYAIEIVPLEDGYLTHTIKVGRDMVEQT